MSGAARPFFRPQWRLDKKWRSSAAAGDRRVNPLGIQMLSKPLYQQIFKPRGENSVGRLAVQRSIEHLRKQKLWGKKGASLPDLNIKLPTMHGTNIDEHFRVISRTQSLPYLELTKKLVSIKLLSMPVKWSSEPGWTRYDPHTGKHERVECPRDDALIFDVETCVSESQRPILAVAASPQAWYSWTSKRLSSNEDYICNMEHNTVPGDLIPLEVDGEVKDGNLRPRIIVGHNVSYDRARIREQYRVKCPSRTKFLDTLSLHVCVAGQTSHQKGIWMSRKKKKKKKKMEESTEGDIPLKKTNLSDLWMEVTCPNNLSDVHWLHVRRGKGKLDKTQRNVFVKGCVQDIRDDFQNLMRYCAEDVLCTHEVLQKLFPQFLSRCPHPVTFAGMLEMATPYLPLDSSWRQYTDDAEYTYEEMEKEIKSKLMTLANEACSLLHNESYLSSPWLCNLDWSTKKFRGKALKTKSARVKLFDSLEKFYQKQEEEFNEEINNTKETKLEFIISSLGSETPKRPVHMPGYPEWYRNLCMKRSGTSWRPGPVHITAQTRVTPYLLRMKWKGHPLHYHCKLGWGYIISPQLPKGENPKFDSDNDMNISGDTGSSIDSLDHLNDLIDKNLEKTADEEGVNVCNMADMKPVTTTENRRKEEEDSEHVKWMPRKEVTSWGITNDVIILGNLEVYYFFKIPHKDGSEANCGNPLSKDFLAKMEDGTLTSAAGQLGQRILILNSMISFWRSARRRILDQFVISLKEKGDSDDESPELSAIIPLVQVAGTVTRRAVEPTWLTASNAKEKRVGSELKAMVRAPPGYHFVGADVDSQELWIAAVLGDMHFTRIHGSTGVGWMTLQGTKAEGTDVHSNTATTIGTDRDQAKILNYGRIYGAGLPFIKLLLRKFNPSLSSMEIETRANTLYTATKGKRVYKLNKEGEKLAGDMGVDIDDGCVDHEDWKLMSSAVGYFRVMHMVSQRIWHGGSESHLFNKLESIASSDLPRTPVLGCCISKALETKYIGGKYQPSKVNWVVQSSAVDYLHLILVCTQWLFEKYNIDGRFCISIHDEVRYLVKSEDKYRAALALQYANLLTRAMFAHQLKMYDLPQSVAFFSAVDIDLVLRKEPSMDCMTPSNPLGLEKGHGTPPGEALDIYQLLNKTNHTLEKVKL